MSPAGTGAVPSLPTLCQESGGLEGTGTGEGTGRGWSRSGVQDPGLSSAPRAWGWFPIPWHPPAPGPCVTAGSRAVTGGDRGREQHLLWGGQGPPRLTSLRPVKGPQREGVGGCPVPPPWLGGWSGVPPPHPCRTPTHGTALPWVGTGGGWESGGAVRYNTEGYIWAQRGAVGHSGAQRARSSPGRACRGSCRAAESGERGRGSCTRCRHCCCQQDPPPPLGPATASPGQMGHHGPPAPRPVATVLSAPWGSDW